MPRSLIRILVILLITVLPVVAQDGIWHSIENKKIGTDKYPPRHVTFLIPKAKNPVIRYNPVSLAFSSLLYFYQSLLSVQISSGCSYEVSCSNFSKAAIKEFGLIKGVALSADRLSRCNQIAAYDIIVSDLDFDNQKVKDDLSQYRWKH
jgi:putative component of membrane protein insertase Oxa1/YidC/SpoIIIJ protein YidD